MESASKAAGVAPDTEKQPARQAPSQQPSLSSPALAAPRSRLWRPKLWGSIGAGLGLLSLVLPLTAAGLWDPIEIDTADQARRAAIHLFGADHLRVEGAPEAIPTVEEVGRGELPVLSMALGLSIFGAHAWAARLPLMLWTLLGALALYWAVARLESRRAALLSVAVYVTSPLVFTQARTAIGEAVTMSALALAFSGLMLSWARLDASGRERWLGFGVGCLGLGAGFWSRGLLIGVAVPALAAGLSWLFLRPPQPRLGSALGASALVIGAAAFVGGVWALHTGDSEVYSKLVGATITDPKQMPTHDVVIHYLGHGLFPWSALLPLSVGVLTRPVAGSRSALRLALILVTALAVLGYAVTIARTGPMPYGAPFALAVLCALTLLSLDKAERGVMPAMIGAALLVLLYKDFDNFPEKGLSALVPGSSVPFPQGMEALGKRYLQIATGLGLAACVILVLSRVRWSSLMHGMLLSKRRFLGLAAALAAGFGCCGTGATADPDIAVGIAPPLAAAASTSSLSTCPRLPDPSTSPSKRST